MSRSLGRSSSRLPCPRSRRAWLLLAAGLALALAGAGEAQVWNTWRTGGVGPYVQLPYEVVFVATKIVERDMSCQVGNPPQTVTVPAGLYEIGTDVVRATRPGMNPNHANQYGPSYNELWVVTREGEVKKLFPLPEHESIKVTHPETGEELPLIHTPMGQLDRGSVVEPNVSEDGQRVLFSYFHDTRDTVDIGAGYLSRKGADLYVMDLSNLIANPKVAATPANLPVTRLTFAGAEDAVERDALAMNPTALAEGDNGWGNVNLHAIEMRTVDGLKYVYVSGEKRLLNSNDQRGRANYNLNLYIADINRDLSLGARRQFLHYTTTSALSPTPLGNGMAFSYQATTGDGRNWQIQAVDSEGRWSPLIGYGSNPDLFHLGGYCLDRTPGGTPEGEYFVAVRYYNENNNGFGALWRQDLASAGLNTYEVVTTAGIKPVQVGSEQISMGVPNGDDPSTVGKVASPRCGRPDELLFAYTPTSANGKICSADGWHHYRAYIAFRDNFEPFNPMASWTQPGSDGLRKLVEDASEEFTLAWPVPMLSWLDRTGDPRQAVADPIIDPDTTIRAGEPFAEVGTSALYNTDRRPYDCFLRAENQPYDPFHLADPSNVGDQIVWNFDALTRVQPDAPGFDAYCAPLTEDDVLGVQVNLTSNQLNHRWNDPDYETDRTGDQETARILGVYDVRGQSDTSFRAQIPAAVPFEFHLLDKDYGLRLVDVRSWHSLQPRETRVDCGGCHQHEVGAAIPFAGTDAEMLPPADFVRTTPSVTYDASCNPVLTTSASASEAVPEWFDDIWTMDAATGFDAYCGSCHGPGGTGSAAFAFTDEQSAYDALRSGQWANAIHGALGSPAFWAARGERTDGRDNSLYQPSSGEPPPYYRFSPVHTTDPGLCGSADPVRAEWVHRFGQWIDHHMPRDRSPAVSSLDLDAKFDRYHPTVDVAVYDQGCLARKVRVGYWDDSGSLAEVTTTINGVVVDSRAALNGSHGYRHLVLADTDVIRVTAEDAAGNRQWTEKAVATLRAECLR